MTDYTDIALSALLPGEPWTSGKALAVYENPIAIAEGAEGAPRVQAAAMADSVAGDTLLLHALGLDVTFTTTSTAIVPGSIFRAVTSCEVRVAGQVQRSDGTAGDGAQLEVFKNTTQVGVAAGTGSYVDLGPVDISLVAGDVIRFVLTAQPVDGSPTARARNITFKTGAVRTVGGI